MWIVALQRDDEWDVRRDCIQELKEKHKVTQRGAADRELAYRSSKRQLNNATISLLIFNAEKKIENHTDSTLKFHGLHIEEFTRDFEWGERLPAIRITFRTDQQ